MFPHCKINLAGLIPCAKYILLVDMVPEDGFRYKVRNPPSQSPPCHQSPTSKGSVTAPTSTQRNDHAAMPS